MTATANETCFNRPDRFAIGWYWVVASLDLPRSGVARANVQGREVVAWRGADGVAHVVDAYCPHMGAHLGDGKVEGDGLRCFFHAWKFAGDGTLVDIPCMKKPVAARIRSWPTAERYGMVWVWTGESPEHDLPRVPEHAADDPGEWRVAGYFQKACHPNVMMINAIDAQHFNSVHAMPALLDMVPTVVSDRAIAFDNVARPSAETYFGRFLRRFYHGPLTYGLRYWFGQTGCVTLGPDFLHFHIVFALRMKEDGGSEGRTLLVTRKRSGPIGYLWSQVLLGLSWVVGAYFAKGDTRVFETIRFNFQTPIRADHAIVAFIQHYDAQPAALWKSWDPVTA